MDTQTAAPTTCTLSPIVALPALATTNLAGFVADCSCGMRMTNTVKSNLEFDLRDHVAYMVGRADRADEKTLAAEIAAASVGCPCGDSLLDCDVCVSKGIVR